MTSSPDVDRDFSLALAPATGGPAGNRPGDLDLEDRHALRRVAGLSTELADITEVEYRALLEYLLPRLRGWGASLARRAGGRVAGGGGIGSRGPGETKIETDRRRIRTRTAKLRREIAQMSAGRELQRRRRSRRNVPSVA